MFEVVLAITLTKAGKRVLMLEAGRDYDPVTETPMFKEPREAPLMGAPTPDKNFSASRRLFVKIAEDNPCGTSLLIAIASSMVRYFKR